jgi:hypothetical protein
MTIATKPCAVIYDQRKQAYCRNDATMFALKDGATSYYCAEHGREYGAKEIDPTNAARDEARTRAQGRIAPDAALMPNDAVILYVEAFIAGAQFAESRRSPTA